MEQFLVEAGLPALFLLSFLASTLVPIGSEWLLAALIINGQPPETVVLVATAGNYLGACTTYLVGFLGSGFLIKKVLKMRSSDQEKAEKIYKKYGNWSLLLSWLPIVGDPICLLGGILRLHFGLFSILVLVGKFIRYAVIAQITAATLPG